MRVVFNALIGKDEEENPPLVNEQIALWRDILHLEMSEEDLVSVLKEYAVQDADYAEIFRWLTTTLQDWSRKPIGVRGREVLRTLLPKMLNQIFSQPN